MILKLQNGLAMEVYKDLDMDHGYIKKIYMFMEGFNYLVLLYQQILSLESI
jgi:hypothetical protein